MKISKFINLEINTEIYKKLGCEINSGINIYKKYYDDQSNTNNYIREQLIIYLNKNYELINILDADINYYIENINLFVEKKFKDIILELDIDHLISKEDYINLLNKNYLYWRNEYYFMINNIILCGKYKPINNTINNLENLINDNWQKINFENIIKFSKTLSKISFLGQNIDNYIKIIVEKFDNPNNICSLLKYINNTFFDNKKEEEKILILDDNITENKKSSKYNFRFIFDNLKSNGYLLFEEFNKEIKNKYKKELKIESIKNDKKLINYFIHIIKNYNTVNKQVNKILLRIKSYLQDLEDNYNNNIGYQKITINQESEKYKLVDLSNYDRTIATFNIFKYSNVNSNSNTKFNIDSKIEPYFDIYKSFYKSRYPDREIEFDLFESTLIIKINLKKDYYIHLALIQYIVLDKIYSNKNEISLIDLSDEIGISINDLEQTINSLLQIKIIKRTNTILIDDIKFCINNLFFNESNKISINSLVEKNIELHKNDLIYDRNTIILSNMYDYIKKNKSFAKNTIKSDLEYKIPFKISDDELNTIIETLLNNEYITKTDIGFRAVHI